MRENINDINGLNGSFREGEACGWTFPAVIYFCVAFSNRDTYVLTPDATC